MAPRVRVQTCSCWMKAPGGPPAEDPGPPIRTLHRRSAQRSPAQAGSPATGYWIQARSLWREQAAGLRVDHGDRHRPVIPAYKLLRMRLEVRKATLALERPSASDHHGTAVREVCVAMPRNDSGDATGATGFSGPPTHWRSTKPYGHF